MGRRHIMQFRVVVNCESTLNSRGSRDRLAEEKPTQRNVYRSGELKFLLSIIAEMVLIVVAWN
jgi:hypothetical protein